MHEIESIYVGAPTLEIAKNKQTSVFVVVVTQQFLIHIVYSPYTVYKA